MAEADPPKPDLELASFDDLMDEICKRADAVVIMGWQRTNKPGVSMDFYEYAGGIPPCIGLCYMMIDRLKTADAKGKPVDGLGT